MVNKKLTHAFKAGRIGSIDLAFGSSVSSTIVRAFRPGRPSDSAGLLSIVWRRFDSSFSFSPPIKLRPPCRGATDVAKIPQPRNFSERGAERSP